MSPSCGCVWGCCWSSRGPRCIETAPRRDMPPDSRTCRGGWPARVDGCPLPEVVPFVTTPTPPCPGPA
eukprot:5428180-Alexandrium_andersonii.AAC.1